MNKISRLPRCQKCGKQMKECIYPKRVAIPFQVSLDTLRFWIHPRYFWYFRCPEKHMGALLIPYFYDTEDKENKQLKYYAKLKSANEPE